MKKIFKLYLVFMMLISYFAFAPNNSNKVYAESYTNNCTTEVVSEFIGGELRLNKNASSKTVDYLNAVQNNNHSEIGWRAGGADGPVFPRYADGFVLTNINNSTQVVVNMFEAGKYLDKTIDIQYEYNNFNVGGSVNVNPIFAIQKNSVTNITQNIYSQGITDYDVIVRFKDHATGKDIALSDVYIALGYYSQYEGTAFGSNIEKIMVKSGTRMQSTVSDGILDTQSGYIYSKNYFWPWLVNNSNENHEGREEFVVQIKLKDNSSYFSYKNLAPNGNTEELNMTSSVNLAIQARNFAIHYNNLKDATHNNPSNYSAGQAITINNPTNATGYTFVKWQEGNQIGVNDRGDKTFTAVWKAIDYSITYVLNGGTNHKDNPNKYTVEDEINIKNPTKNGYTFTGWKEGSRIPKGSTGNKTFTAEWKINDYKINYVLNGGTNHKDNPATYTINDEINILDPSRTGYEFIGWKEGNKIAKGSTGDKTFTAEWKGINYPITYVLDGGINNPENPSEYTVEQTISIKDPTKEGYRFLGWQEGNSIPKGSTGAKTFTAKWEYVPHTQFVDEDGAAILETKEGTHQAEEIENYVLVETVDLGKGDLKHIYHLLKTNYIDDNNNPIAPQEDGTKEPKELEGYKLLRSDVKDNKDVDHVYHKFLTKWLDENLEALADEEFGSLPAKEFDKYIFKSTQLLENGDTIHYYNKLVNVKFLVNEEPIKEEIIEKGEDGTPPDVEKEGYEFKGWDIPYDNVQEDIEVRAIFEPIKYPIIYVLNGGNNNKANPGEYTIEDEVDILDPNRLFHKFMGWYEDPHIAKGSTGQRVFTAIWDKEVYPINYILDGGKNNPLNPVQYCEDDEIFINNPSKEGFIFIGWIEGSSIPKGSHGEKTFTAKWAKLHSVTFKDGDIVLKIEDGIKDHGKATAPKEPTKDGYTFKGWDVEFDDITGDLVVKALWEKNPEPIKEFTVVFKDGDQTLKTETVKEHGFATAPSVSKQDHKFIGWDKKFDDITGDLIVNAKWEKLEVKKQIVPNTSAK